MNRKRRAIWLILSVCFVCMLTAMPASAKGKSASKKIPKKIVLNRTELLLYPGEERKLSVERVKPEKASAKVAWKSKKKTVATVSPKGELKARKPGKTTITAVSKKNPKVKAVVKVTVKKRPEKKEKECAFEYKRHDYGSNWLNNYARIQRRNPVIFRNKEDILTYIEKTYPGKNFYKIMYDKKGINWAKKDWNKVVSQTFLSEYLKMDFKKESLVVFFDTAKDILSLQTRLDSAGKLQGIVKVRYYPPKPSKPGIAMPTIVTSQATTLKISKQDEAMIDYYQFEAVKEE